MKTTLKAASVAVLICFSSTFAFGADTIRTKITLTPVSAVFYENYVGIDTPTVNQEFSLHLQAQFNDELVTSVIIKDLAGFNFIGPPQIEQKDGTAIGNVFALKAPSSEGTYKMLFQGKTKTGKVFDFSTEIKVVESDSMQTWMRIGLVVGVFVVAIAALLLISNSGK